MAALKQRARIGYSIDRLKRWKMTRLEIDDGPLEKQNVRSMTSSRSLAGWLGWLGHNPTGTARLPAAPL